jgi:hypothetical protein
VFNSYGKRPNDNLLLDYGFSMLENEWDTVDLVFQISREVISRRWDNVFIDAIINLTY